MSGVVIIGAGHAGSQLAVSLRAEGYKGAVTLIDAADARGLARPYLVSIPSDPALAFTAASNTPLWPTMSPLA